ncbi:hypothetical protein V9K67_10465 [Paraflavisolibacter sp. H34]|uniref:hypothetical protein n=1 Tax=Huijunlia imazamoxiresistens TaxID=3127457 RepID=UPI0030159221
MKQLFIALICLPLASLAQDCPLKKEVDKFSQEPRLSTGFMSFNEGGHATLLSLDADAKEINLLFSLKRTGESPCFDEESTAVITYEGKASKSTFRNSGAMNCNGIFQVTFKNVPTTPSILQRLATQKITSITLTGTPKPIIITLDSDQQQTFSSRANCLITEAKSLIKK